MKLLDLASVIGQLSATTVSARRDQLKDTLKSGVYLTAIGGIPVEYNGDYTLFGKVINAEVCKELLTISLGQSALLTYLNKSQKSLSELGTLCKKLDHTWGYNWMNLSLVFVGKSPNVELALCRDKNFFMSWIEQKENDSYIYMAVGSIKSWKKYASRYEDKSFDVDSRETMIEVRDLLKELSL